MRIVRFFFFSILGLTITGAIFFFLGRNLLLIYSSNLLSRSVERLNKGNFSTHCQERFAGNQESYPQIRFTSEKDFNLEVVCSSFEEKPIILEEKHLPPLVEKTSTTSGFILKKAAYPSYIELKSMGRKATAYIEDNVYHFSFLSRPDLDYSMGPKSNCQAFASTCCSLDLETGLGQQITEVTDCPKSCYSQCAVRPIILSFNNRPADDQGVIYLKSGQAVSFAYVVTASLQNPFGEQSVASSSVGSSLRSLISPEQKKGLSAALPIMITIDFGDGQSFQSQSLQESLDHVYTCGAALCYYQVRIQAIDAAGVSSLDDELSRLTVNVSR